MFIRQKGAGLPSVSGESAPFCRMNQHLILLKAQSSVTILLQNDWQLV